MISKKLSILRESDVIDEQTEQFVISVNKYLLENKIVMDEAHLDMFLTHLAMAEARQKKNETVVKMDETILTEIKNDKKLQQSVDLWTKLAPFSSIEFSEEEIWFVHMHIINILNKEQ